MTAAALSAVFVCLLSLSALAGGMALLLHPDDRPRHLVGGLVLLAGGGIGLMTVVAPAFAADAPAAVTTIDLSALVSALVSAAATVLTGLGSWALLALRAYVARRTGLETDAATREYLDRALNHAVSWGAARAERALAGKDGVTDLDLHNATLAAAAQYALDLVPDALAHFGVTAGALETMLEARLATLLPPSFVPADFRVVGERGPELAATGVTAALTEKGR